MLNDKQILYLASLSDFGRFEINGKTTGIKLPQAYHNIKVDYNEFKDNMGLDDLRFSWLLGKKNVLAGGAVLSWITGDNNHGDVDFFFLDTDATEMFKLFIENYGFVSSRETNYALTCFNEEEKVIIQIVGYGPACDMNKRFFGQPFEIIDTFDITLCKFAVDCDYLYTNTMTIRDLITRSIRIKQVHETTTNRVLKYNRKGFYVPGKLLEYNGSYTDLLDITQVPAW